MKLSMWILADRLCKLNPKTYIRDGTNTIGGIRIFSGVLPKTHPDILYIWDADAAFSYEKYRGAVLLIHRHDLMCIEGHKKDVVVDEVLAALNHYNNWEEALRRAAAEGSVQRLIDLCAPVIPGAAVVTDGAGQVMGHNTANGQDPPDARWRHFLSRGRIDQDVFDANYLYATGQRISDWDTKPALYRRDYGLPYIAAHIAVAGERVAALYIQQTAKPFHEGDCQLANTLCEAIAQCFHGDNTEAHTGASMLSALLRGEENNLPVMERIAENTGISPPHMLLIVRDTRNNFEQIANQLLLAEIRSVAWGVIATTLGNDVVIVLSERDAGDMADKLESIAGFHGVGWSLPFYGWQELPARHRQALFALEQGKGRRGHYYLQQYAYTHLRHNLCTRNRELELIHPALEVLRQYDRAHKTQLCETMYQYLVHERNAIRAAKAMYLHRNTLNYRLKRISALADVNLDDPDERMHILLSYILWDNR